MNPIKFLRKYTRTLLMVFMSFLLVAFLVPQQITSCRPDQGGVNAARGEAYNQTISDADIRQASNELDLLRGMGFRTAMGPGQALEYCLMSMQADELGLHVGNEEVKERLRRAGFSDPLMQQMQRRSRLSYDQIYSVIGRWMAVNRLLSAEGSALFDSIRRKKLAFRDQVQRADALVSVIDSRAFIDQVPEPTEEQLQAFFDECKVRNTAHTTDELVFGYRLPDRIQLEYLTINPEAVREEITVKRAQMRDFFEDHRAYYTMADPDAPQPADGSAPAQIQMTFEQAADRVREDVRRREAIETAQRLVNSIYDELHRPWLAQPTGDDGFVHPPEIDFRPLQEVKEQAMSPFPIEYRQTGVIPVDEVRSLGGLGTAGVGEGRARAFVPQIVARVKGLLDQKPENDAIPAPNVYEPLIVFTRKPDPVIGRSVPHQAYVFRITRVVPSAPPESMEGIRDQVVQDWKRVQAFALARQQAEELAEQARAVGLATAVEQATDLKDMLTAAARAATQPAGGAAVMPKYVEDLQPTQPKNLTRQSTMSSEIGSIAGLPEHIFALADEPAGADQHRVTVAPLARANRWFVAELQEVHPIYQTSFEQRLATGQAGRPSWQEEQRFGAAWANPENVQLRTGFESYLEDAEQE